MKPQNNLLWKTLIFLIIQILVVIRNYHETFRNFFWFCDFAPTLFMLGFYFNNTQFIKGIIHIGLIPQLLFIFGLLIETFTGAVIISTISLTNLGLFYWLISMIIHGTSLIALYFTRFDEPQKGSLIFSLIVLTGMYLITALFTPMKDEFNYVFSYRSLTDIHIPFYFELWVPIVFTVVVLPTYFLQKKLLFRSK